MIFEQIRKRYKIIIIIVATALIALFFVFGYRFSYNKNIEKIDIKIQN